MTARAAAAHGRLMPSPGKPGPPHFTRGYGIQRGGADLVDEPIIER
jgi:hypothetical protein